jgi:dTDP-4-dehydrorhamnose 3,5-epimerase-like enzyme
MGMVKAVRLEVPVDDRGELFEILRRDDAGFQGFGQVYFVRSRTPGIVRGFHRHDSMWDHFCIVNGAAKFGFVDPQHTPCVNGCADGPIYWITLSDRCPARLDVPPGVWHGWMALEPNTLLVSVASEPYKGDNREGVLDEERVPATTFGADWRVEAK